MADLKQNNADIRAGVIEGFFGKPWSFESRLSSADFLRDSGYQFYIYRSPIPSFAVDGASLFRRRRRDI